MTGIHDTQATLADLGNCVRRASRALQFTTERDLQESLASLLAAEGYTAEREKALAPGERPDFLLDTGIAIEVKVKGPIAQLERQVRRYLAHPQVTGVLVVTTRARHRSLPDDIDGKPVRVTWVASPF